MILEKIVSQYTNYLTIRHIKKRYNINTAQRVLVQYILNKEQIFRDDGKVIYKNIIEVRVNKNSREPLNLPKNEIIERLEKEKHFLIDLSLYHLHHRKGKKSLLIQVSQSLKEIREYLFDTNLILIGDLDYSFLGKNMVKIYKNRKEFLFERFRGIILDPCAEDVLTDEDIKKYDLFILGGIVDVGLNWHGATSYLFRNLDLPRKKIVLNGNIKGVPDRINILIKVILETYYKNIPLERAIVMNQTKKDILERVWYEVKQHKINNTIKKESLREIIKYVNVSEEWLIRFLKKHRIRIE
ncbi:MAG TPA: hypothetical protein EYH22_01100 [Candidatus Nanopusillus sp.]|nr:hypothetical protein [Candidatus Nanopusillus sp.]